MKENVTRSMSGEYFYEWDEEVTLVVNEAGGEVTGHAGICLSEEDLRDMIDEIQTKKEMDK